MNQSKRNILALLNLRCQGKSEAIKAGEITGMTGIGCKEVQKIIRELRREGHPIAADYRLGYWWIVDPREHKQWLDQMKRRAFDVLKTVSIQAHITAAELAGQLTLELEGR